MRKDASALLPIFRPGIAEEGGSGVTPADLRVARRAFNEAFPPS